jgi:hypothetical protein
MASVMLLELGGVCVIEKRQTLVYLFIVIRVVLLSIRCTALPDLPTKFSLSC